MAYQKAHDQHCYFPRIHISAEADPHQYNNQRASQGLDALEPILFQSRLKTHDFLGLTLKTAFLPLL